LVDSLAQKTVGAFYRFVGSQKKITDDTQERLGFFLLRKTPTPRNYTSLERPMREDNLRA